MLSKKLLQAVQDAEFQERTIDTQARELGAVKDKLQQAENERDAAILAGFQLERKCNEKDATIRTQADSITSWYATNDRHRKNLAAQDELIASLRQQIKDRDIALEDANNTIANQDQHIEALKGQVCKLGEKLDAYRYAQKGHATSAPAHGSISTDSQYHKDNSPRN